MKLTTLVIGQHPNEDLLLLIEKKRGLGKGFWNFPGGKVDKGEEIHQAAHRELFEETGLRAQSLKLIALLRFVFETERSHHNNSCHVYRTQIDDLKTTPTDNEECRAFWYSKSKIDWNRFWPGDRLWVPRVLDGGEIQANLTFGSQNELLNFEITSDSI